MMVFDAEWMMCCKEECWCWDKLHLHDIKKRTYNKIIDEHLPIMYLCSGRQYMDGYGPGQWWALYGAMMMDGSKDEHLLSSAQILATYPFNTLPPFALAQGPKISDTPYCCLFTWESIAHLSSIRAVHWYKTGAELFSTKPKTTRNRIS
jgi:hypothetical protein